MLSYVLVIAEIRHYFVSIKHDFRTTNDSIINIKVENLNVLFSFFSLELGDLIGTF